MKITLLSFALAAALLGIESENSATIIFRIPAMIKNLGQCGIMYCY